MAASHERPTTEDESYSTPLPLVCVAEPDAASVDGSVESGPGLGHGLGLEHEHERVPEPVPVGEWPKLNDDNDGDDTDDDNDDERANSAAEIVGQATRAE